MERAKLSDGARKAIQQAKATAGKKRNGGVRPGAGRKKGVPNFIKTNAHISVLARPCTPRLIRDMLLMAFGTTKPNEEEGNKRLRTKDDWLRFSIMKFLAERGWGRAPQEVNIQVSGEVNYKYSRAELAKLTLEQLSAVWREQVASSARVIDQSSSPTG
jgi:hypothetical protein